MSTLLMRFAGPMQSWGTDSKYEVRRTQREPSKSGVIGLIAAAMGKRRDDDLSELNSLKMGIRVDREGRLLRDFHIVRKMKGDSVDISYVTRREYLCDAVFLVGIESEDENMLHKIREALTYPAFPLFLGRRSCPPEGRVLLGIRNKPLREALETEPLLVEARTASYPIQIMCDSEDKDAVATRDFPISYSPEHRMYTYRMVTKTYMKASQNEHDPMKELR